MEPTLLIGGALLLYMLFGNKKKTTSDAGAGGNKTNTSTPPKGTYYSGGKGKVDVVGDLTDGTKTNRAGIKANQVHLYKGDLNKHYHSFYDFRNKSNFDSYEEDIGYIKGDSSYRSEPPDRARFIRIRPVYGKIAINYTEDREIVARVPIQKVGTSGKPFYYPIYTYATGMLRLDNVFLYGFKFQLEILNPYEVPVTITDLKVERLTYCGRELVSLDFIDMAVKNGFQADSKSSSLDYMKDDIIANPHPIIDYYLRNNKAPFVINEGKAITLNPGSNFVDLQLWGNDSQAGFTFVPGQTEIVASPNMASVQIDVVYKSDIISDIRNSFGIMASGQPAVTSGNYWQTQYWTNTKDWELLTAVNDPVIDNVFFPRIDN